jgi:hypothetical protein
MDQNEIHFLYFGVDFKHNILFNPMINFQDDTLEQTTVERKTVCGEWNSCNSLDMYLGGTCIEYQLG